MNPTIYLDNAATTPLDNTVLQTMMPYLTNMFGNPSSSYSHGRSARLAIETSRKTVASLLGVKPSTILFTSGGTESNNTAIATALRDLGCTHIITSPIEHHAVLHSVDYYIHQYQKTVSHVALTSDGNIDYTDLESQLKKQTEAGNKCFVSLMHANNEIGSLLDINRISVLCKKFGAIFHSDCVQTIGHYPLNLADIGVHFASGASHKFYGPKGVGILYIKEGLHIQPLIYGGGQERNKRAGTENVYGIVGFAKALELAMQAYENDCSYISCLKSYMKKRLFEKFPDITFNGPKNSLYTVLSVSFPKTPESDFLTLTLDMEGVCVSEGSACNSNANSGSHVINALQKLNNSNTIRFSFSKYNTIEEIDQVIEILENSLNVKKAIPKKQPIV